MTLASRVNFGEHRFRLGSDDAARVDFHRMLTALIQVEYPTATEVRPNPGDWGIDTFVGSLVDKVNIWQSKYFADGIDKSQKDQVRESLVSAMTNASANGYVVESWILCVPCDLDPPERQWWDRRCKAWAREFPGVVFDLWDAPRLRGKLMSPDAAHVCEEFYGPARVWIAQPQIADIVALPAQENYEGALFVKQLAAAGLLEVDAQKVAFFNAEVLARDVVNRGVPEERQALLELDYTVWELWEQYAGVPSNQAGVDAKAAARTLLAAVMQDVRRLPSPGPLPTRAVHHTGMMHRVVETGRAGWVANWRRVAAEHTEQCHVDDPSTSTTLAVQS
ncbi:hypothetical protein [Actinoplanes sp. ATCC 53533]|uniref:hypothetical protein n=1 Tax=Actinoplanes sp. ATCC 53533 TaxID=1288362 RepID=UPI000F783D14|nr:hypothetical protein [Actinoplanes sp. ATCC 53533]